MNLSKLFEIQKQLDDRIVEKHGLQGEDLLPKKILALQVELGELANEWRGFKFWSEDQEPRRKSFRWVVVEEKGNSSLEQEVEYYPLLEEYVDCLHFLLSIGLEIGGQPAKPKSAKKESVLDQFHKLFYLCANMYYWHNDKTMNWKYLDTFEHFLGLGEMLGFTWNEIEQAYLEKNKVNHQRQESGY